MQEPSVQGQDERSGPENDRNDTPGVSKRMRGAGHIAGNMPDHLKKCPKRVFRCVECEFKGPRDLFLKHVVEKHESALVGIFDQDAREDIEKTKIVTRPHSVEGGLLNFDRICRTVNDAGAGS